MKKKVKCAMDIGEQMLISGAEVHRVEDSIQRICYALGAVRADIFIITTSMVVTVFDEHGKSYTQTRRIASIGNNMEKLHKLNELSRRICDKKISESEIAAEIEIIKNIKTYPKWLEFICYALIASAFTFFWGGGVFEALVSVFIGIAVCAVINLSDRIVKNKIFSRFAASFAATALAYAALKTGVIGSVDKVIIGNIMCFIPGIGFTNALRDLFTGDSIAGILRFIEAVLIALAIAAGYFLFAFLIGGII